MTGDLPDYHEYVVPAPEIPGVEVGVINVAEYDATPEDVPDGERGPLLIDIKGRLYVIQYGVTPISGSQPVIPRPKGGILAKGSATTTNSYATIASRTVTSGKTLQLSKIVVSAEKATWIVFRWAGSAFSAERLMDDKTILIEHFPWDYNTMLGDGAKAFDVQAKYYTAAGVINIEIVGEEVTP